MARKRTIHPGAPHDEAVASCSLAARHLWAYLPCHADRLGRLEDKPFDLKLRIMPMDPVDMDQLLGELAAPHAPGGRPLTPLIERYEVAGRRYIQIRSFLRYQTPHHREAASVIPPPPRSGPGQVVPSPGKVVPEPDLGEASPDLFAASPSDPDPDPGTDPDRDYPARADLPADPRARAIPDVVASPEAEPVYHHVVVRARPPTTEQVSAGAAGWHQPDSVSDPCGLIVPRPPARDPPAHRALRLLALFGRLANEAARARGQPEQGFHPGPACQQRAEAFIAQIADDRQACLDVEPAMRLRIEDAWDSQHPKDDDPGWVFLTFFDRFDGLRKRVRGTARAVAVAGLTDRERKSLSNGQLWLEAKRAQEERR